MSRRQARELALQALFQLDFNSDAETIAAVRPRKRLLRQQLLSWRMGK